MKTQRQPEGSHTTGADDLCNPQSCSGFPTHPYIVNLQDFTVLQGPSDTCHQEIPTCQAEQAGAESQALPHSIPGENKQELPRNYRCSHSVSRGAAEMEIPAAKQSPGRGRAPLSSPVPSQHRAWCSAHTGHWDSTICHPPRPLCTLFSKKNRLCITAQSPDKLCHEWSSQAAPALAESQKAAALQES